MKVSDVSAEALYFRGLRTFGRVDSGMPTRRNMCLVSFSGPNADNCDQATDLNLGTTNTLNHNQAI